ncbi:hypothetical protein C5167_006298 [Papaver somniferum]|uniref:Uncharacterized protein n=1 Tax=Papaver somniferum TaxID=3469 RepID=A0A4Y7JEP2_PAPSO|nr:hypothetical protein C5167_006298 [Papaver somniferum]
MKTCMREYLVTGLNHRDKSPQQSDKHGWEHWLDFPSLWSFPLFPLTGYRRLFGAMGKNYYISAVAGANNGSSLVVIIITIMDFKRWEHLYEGGSKSKGRTVAMPLRPRRTFTSACIYRAFCCTTS